MREAEVLLDSIDKVKGFVSIAAKFDANMDLVRGRCTVDAKSIMGIFCLNLSKELMLRIHEGKENADTILNALTEYVVQGR